MQFTQWTLSNRIRLWIRNQRRQGLSTRNALGISILLHVMAGAAFASLWLNHVKPHHERPDELVFDIVDVQPPAPAQTAANRDHGVTNPEAQKVSGRASNPVKGNMNRQAVVTASLAALSDLRDTFNFTRSVSADSVGGFSPIEEGTVPGSSMDSFGNQNGEGAGRGKGFIIRVGGGGGGTCDGPTILP